MEIPPSEIENPPKKYMATCLISAHRSFTLSHYCHTQFTPCLCV